MSCILNRVEDDVGVVARLIDEVVDGATAIAIVLSSETFTSLLCVAVSFKMSWMLFFTPATTPGERSDIVESELDSSSSYVVDNNFVSNEEGGFRFPEMRRGVSF